MKNDMVRKEETKMATELKKGLECVDKYPCIRYKDIEDVAKEVIDEDPQLDKLWKMIENDLRDKFIDKAYEWLNKRLNDYNIPWIENEYCWSKEIFLQQFRKAMEGD